MSTDIDLLIDRWLDGEASDTEIESLEAALNSSDEARRQLVRATRLQASLLAGHAACASPGLMTSKRSWPAIAAAILAFVIGSLVFIGRQTPVPSDTTTSHRRISIHIDRPEHPLPERRISKLVTNSDHRIRL